MVRESDLGTVERIGQALFSQYVLPFEIASILLLVAMVGAIYLSKQKLQLGEEPRARETAAETAAVEDVH